MMKNWRVLENIKINTNSYFADEIKEFLQNGTLSESDLISCGIPPVVIETLNDNNLYYREPYSDFDRSESVIEGYTEVYFWGVPGSGKTCALAAILSMAEKLGYLNIANGLGYDYMTWLKTIFAEKNALLPVLPPPTCIDVIRYLPFKIKKDNERNYRLITFIEPNGEVFQCFQKTGLNMPSQFHVDTFNLLQRFLNSSNRKIHFFFIDYGDENKMNYMGLTQSDYLLAASTFFESNQVFKKNTDAIYVVLTKSDLMPCSENERVAKAKEYLKDNYVSFINALKDSCKKHSINSGRLTVELFSLGKVYFNQICDFDGTTAENIINILLDRVPTSKNSILDFFKLH